MFIKEIERFLEEDMYYDDASGFFIPDKFVDAKIFCKVSCVVSGIGVAESIFKYFDIEYETLVSNGNIVDSNTVFFKIRGEAKNILKAERLTLNFLSHLCGIATNTHEYTKLIRKACDEKNSDEENCDEENCDDCNEENIPKIAGTRKTMPGLRKFEKEAVAHGGGDTHRKNLSECIMIKDNHIEVLGLKESIILAKKHASFTQKIEVEVENENDALIAAETGADIIMFDNMKPEEIKSAINLLIENNLRKNVIIEASGGITKDTISYYATTGVDIISVSGVITQAPWIDIGLDIENL
ncbi:MAG: carboxylating nicotinate-nucleotide diphosphorylase [Methanosarcinaceae archaeon]|nr:carboxylating nicotinate-nucleotide diphosphorylase [Methanosarcinaceae archaeon]